MRCASSTTSRSLNATCFIDANLDVYNKVMGKSMWWPNIMKQTTIRALTKLEFAYGLVVRMADAV